MISDAKRAQAFAVRDILNGVVRDIVATDEASFNSVAALINEKAAAIPVWRSDLDYQRGDLVVDREDGTPYWAIHAQGPTSGQVHQPSKSPTMWTHCHGTTPETARPFVAESYNAYMTGHYCTEGDTVARCLRDNVVFPPSVLPDAWEVTTDV